MVFDPMSRRTAPGVEFGSGYPNFCLGRTIPFIRDTSCGSPSTMPLEPLV
jgi:hypothetical protein